MFNRSIVGGERVWPAIDQGAVFEDGDACTLTRTPGSAGNRKTFTISFWYKRVALGLDTRIIAAGSNGTELFWDANDKLNFYYNSGGFDFQYITTKVFRDTTNHGQIHITVDTRAAVTAADRVIITDNGVRITDFDTENTPSDDVECDINNTSAHWIGRYSAGASNYLDAIISEFHLVDGSVEAATDFGEFDPLTPIYWRYKAYTGSYGTNGFHLDFSNTSNYGEDQSGNGNNLTDSGFTTASTTADTPTNNYPVLNSIHQAVGAAVTISDGGLHVTGTTTADWNQAFADMELDASAGGKWIFCAKPALFGQGHCQPFIFNEEWVDAATISTASPGANSWGIAADGSTNFLVWNEGTGTTYTMSPIWESAADMYVCALDLDNMKVWWGRWDNSTSTLEWANATNTAWTGDPTDGGTTGETIDGNTFGIGFSTYTGRSGDVDFGQRNLLDLLTLPTGYTHINAANIELAEGPPAILDPTAHFQTTLYVGNGTAIGSGGKEVNQAEASTFPPDLAWIKNRTTPGNEHDLYDAVRGVTKALYSSTTGIEGTQTEGLTSFDTDGFTVGSRGEVNTNTDNIVAWQWLANGAGSSNTDGSINTTATSANTTAGFSISKYAGSGSNATVGHGLGTAPKMVIVKEMTNIRSWVVYHEGIGDAAKVIYLNQTAAAGTDATVWNSTAPTSTVFSVGTANGSNGSGNTYIAYCFAEISGYSSIGSYTGNGNASGPFVYCGFKPAFILIKSVGVEEWSMTDSTRDPTNRTTTRNLVAHSSAAEADAATRTIDYLSNGFKIRNTNSAHNSSGVVYTYMAIAESPALRSNAR